MCAQLCPGHIDPGWPQISEGLRRLPVSKEDFVEAGEAAGIISAKEQILIFGPHELWDRVAVAVKPFDAPHPSRVRQIESVPGVSADFGVGSAKGEKSDRMPFVPKHNGLGTGQVYVRIALEEFDLALEPGGVGYVVLIHSREVLSSREVYPLVESGRQAQVHSILDDPDSVVRSRMEASAWGKVCLALYTGKTMLTSGPDAIYIVTRWRGNSTSPRSPLRRTPAAPSPKPPSASRCPGCSRARRIRAAHRHAFRCGARGRMQAVRWFSGHPDWIFQCRFRCCSSFPACHAPRRRRSLSRDR